MTAILIGILRVLVLLLIIRFVMRGIAALLGRQAGRPRPQRVAERAGGTLVRDPHCGTYVPESRALSVGTGSDVVHFCSSACRDAWQGTGRGAKAKAWRS